MKQYFDIDEFKCNHCGRNEIDYDFVKNLNVARSIAGVPFFINSGYRCPVHNRAVGGTEDSSHLSGYAADICATHARNRFLIVQSLIQAGFHRIGIGVDFIHVDDDPDKDAEVMWVYG